jgi:hypothetical protein
MSHQEVIRNKCRDCGLVNLATDERCRRCGAELKSAGDDAHDSSETVEVRKRGPARRLAWILGMTLTILFVCYVSLLVTSDALAFEQKQMVHRAVEILDQRGFGREAFLLHNLASYRSTDNWWNTYIGHHDAYAATNFPFEVLTLYPEFFDAAVDDNERAAILLHESYHLHGSGEQVALEGVWREKGRLGWTEDKYGHTKVFNNTKELTMRDVPKLFQCGENGQADCVR